MKRRLLPIAFITLAMLVGVNAAHAAFVIDFKPEPANTLPEVIYVGAGPAVPSLRAGPGAVGNGDGALPPNQQTPGGLTVEVPYLVPGIFGGTVNAGGSTTFRDVTLELTGLSQNGGATTVGDVTTQGLTSGTFRLLATSGVLGAPPLPLLEGNIGGATLALLNTGATGALLSSTVTYTGGPLIPPGLIGATGDLSFSLINITPLFVVSPGIVTDFSADATGQFTIVPEPGGLALAAAACGALLVRRRRATSRPSSF